jgi:RHS repeat-associated protein
MRLALDFLCLLASGFRNSNQTSRGRSGRPLAAEFLIVKLGRVLHYFISRSRRPVSLFAVLFTGMAVSSSAQTPNSTGVQLFSTQTGSTFDTVNLSSSNIMFTLPIRSKNGPIPFSFSLRRNPTLGIINAGTDFAWYLVDSGAMRLTAGAPLEDIGVVSTPVGYQCQVSNGVFDNYNQYNNNSVIDATGAIHPLAGSLSYNPCTQKYSTPLQTSFLTTDGSGYTGVLTSIGALTPPAFTIYDKSGNQKTGVLIAGSALNVATPNGVTATATVTGSSTQYADPLGTTVLTSSNSSPSISFTYKDSSGDTQTATESFSTYTFRTNFGCAPNEAYPYPYSFPTSLSLPDGRSFGITYEPTPGYAGSTTGRIASITLPTGGSISYTYTGGNNNTGVYCDYVAGTGEIPTTPILTRTVNDANGVQSIWTYSFSDSPNPNNQSTTTVKDPANNITVYTFVAGYQIEQQVYQGAVSPSNLLKTVVTCYNNNFTNCATQTVAPVYPGGPITQTDVYTSYNGGAPSLVETKYNSAGMPIEVKQYDYGAAMPPTGTPLIDTTTSYGSWNGSSCSAIPNNILDRPCEVIATSPTDVVSHTRSTYDNAGNLIALAKLVSGSTYNTQSYTYTSNGSLLSAKDAKGNTTNYKNAACNNLLPTQVSQGPITINETWDCNGAVVTSKSGPNTNQTTTYTYSDPLYRLTEIQYPDGGQTNLCYTDVGGSLCTQSSTINSTYTRVMGSPSPNLLSSVIYDGLNREIKRFAPNGAAVVTNYNASGYAYSITNPHFSTASPSDGFTSYVFDALGRTRTQYNPSGTGSLTWGYNGNVVTYKDGNSNVWTRTYDGLGNLTKVVEPSLATTTYAYDGANLISVTQPGLSGETPRALRTFTYDSSSQLIQAFNPESGWTCYGTTGGAVPNGTNCTTGYDANGNLTAKTDARGLTISYSFDTLNRMTGTTYSDSTPPVSYNYDESTVSWSTAAMGNTIGLLSSASVGGTTPYSRYAYSYDLMGRPTYKQFMMPNSSGTSLASGVGSSSTTYDEAGDVTAITEGPGINLYLTRDSGGHVLTATSNKNTTNLLNGVFSHTLFTNATYSPFGRPLSRLFGNGLTETRVYDSQGRLQSVAQAQSGTMAYSSSVTYQLNGNVNSSTDSVNGNWTQYTYDSTNRLTQATSAAGLTLGWTYDSFGNRKAQTATGTGSAPQPSFTFSGNNNRADASGGFAYDAAGNITTDNLGQSYQFDADGRISSVSGGISGNAVYKYDSEGQLVYESGAHGIQVFQRNAAGQPTYIYNPTTTTTPPYLFFGGYIDGEEIGSWQTPNATFSWIGKDWLGTKRYESQGLGDGSTATPLNPVPYTSLPFGDGLNTIGNAPTHFTGKEQDVESGNDYFGARYYSSSTGRFMSPDDGGDWDLRYPQSWNLYSYVRNNPLTNIDPNGHDCVYLNAAGDGAESIDPESNGANQADCMGDGLDNKGTGGYWVNGKADTLYTDPNSNAVALTGIDRTTGMQTQSSIYNSGSSVTVTATDPSQIGVVPLSSFYNYSGPVHLVQQPEAPRTYGILGMLKSWFNCWSTDSPEAHIEPKPPAPHNPTETVNNKAGNLSVYANQTGKQISPNVGNSDSTEAMGKAGEGAAMASEIANCVGGK